MRKSRSKSKIPLKPEWATTIADLRQHLNLSQAVLGDRLNASAMAISRWERGSQEPSAGTYIQLGEFAGAPLCWYFWGRAGLSKEVVTRVMPEMQSSEHQTINLQIVSAGSGVKKSKAQQLVAIPLLKVVAASHGEKGDSSAILQDAPVESVIAAPKAWCPNPASTSCLRVRGNSMNPLIYDGYILAADSSQTEHAKLDGKIVIAAHRDDGLSVSRLQAYDHTEVLRAENNEYGSVVLRNNRQWKIVAKVLWWIGKAP